MASYDTAEKERLLSIPVATVLEHFGCRTDHRGQMYFSPFRDEREPSFHVSDPGGRVDWSRASDSGPYREGIAAVEALSGRRTVWR